jgi:hypothetical protein
MIKRFASAALVAGLVTVGAASASSLGSFDNPTLASSLVEVRGCEAGDNAEISFTTSQAADAAIQPATAFVSSMTVTGLEECDGAQLGGQLIRKNAAGGDQMMGYFSGGEIQGGAATVNFASNSRKVEDVEKVLLVVTD